MCAPEKYGRPSMFCLVPLALLCTVLGGGLVGTWVACYYTCKIGKELVYNYYSSVWTGGIAVFSGLLQLFIVCCWNKAMKYFLVSINILLILCCLVCAALSGYNTYLESVVFNLVGSAETPPSLGTIITGLEALLAVCILVLILVWNCVIVCSGVDSSPEIYDEDRNRPRKTTRPTRQQAQGIRGPYEEEFFNQEPAIFRDQQQYQERTQEVMYGHSNTGTGPKYVIPRASVRGHSNENGYYGNERGTMVVDGREGRRGNEDPRSFYSGSSRHHHQNGGNVQNGGHVQNGGPYRNGTGTGTSGRVGDLGSRPGDLTNNRYGQSINLMNMHGVAPTTHITDGYY